MYSCMHMNSVERIDWVLPPLDTERLWAEAHPVEKHLNWTSYQPPQPTPFARPPSSSCNCKPEFVSELIDNRRQGCYKTWDKKEILGNLKARSKIGLVDKYQRRTSHRNLLYFQKKIKLISGLLLLNV